MTRIYQSWRCQIVPTNRVNERYVATFGDQRLVAATVTTLQRKIEAAMEEVFA